MQIRIRPEFRARKHCPSSTEWQPEKLSKVLISFLLTISFTASFAAHRLPLFTKNCFSEPFQWTADSESGLQNQFCKTIRRFLPIENINNFVFWLSLIQFYCLICLVWKKSFLCQHFELGWINDRLIDILSKRFLIQILYKNPKTKHFLYQMPMAFAVAYCKKLHKRTKSVWA